LGEVGEVIDRLFCHFYLLLTYSVTPWVAVLKVTRSSAVAERPPDASSLAPYFTKSLKVI